MIKGKKPMIQNGAQLFCDGGELRSTPQSSALMLSVVYLLTISDNSKKER